MVRLQKKSRWVDEEAGAEEARTEGHNDR